MSEKENIHSGHRKRMLDKIANNSNNVLDHELLEVLLYGAIPRINTNPIAHRLIKTFGSLRAVLLASAEQLKAVDGVGEKTAKLLTVYGALIKKMDESEKQSVVLGSFEKVKLEIEKLFKDEEKERFSLLLLDKNYKRIAVFDFSSKSEYAVNAEVGDVAKCFAVYKPKHAIIAHNHPSGLAEPSESDDLATKKINFLCMVHGVNLADHVIYGKGNVYSYMQTGKLDKIKKKADLNALLNNL